MRMSDWSSDVCDSELRLQHKGRRRVRIKRSDHIEQEIVQCLLLVGAVTRAECQSQIFRDLICRLPEDGNGFGIDEAAAIISGCQVIRRRRDESEIVERNGKLPIILFAEIESSNQPVQPVMLSAELEFLTDRCVLLCLIDRSHQRTS